LTSYSIFTHPDATNRTLHPRSIPFALSVPSTPIARDEMDTAAFNAMTEEGLSQAKAGHGHSLDEAFDLSHQGV